MGNKQQQQSGAAWMEAKKTLHLSHEELERRREMLEKMMREDEAHEDSLLMSKRSVRAPILQGFTSDILSAPDFKVIMAKLPPECARATWVQLFCSNKNGKSFTTFYNSIIDKGPVVVVVQDKDGHVFGGFVSPNVVLSQKEYFGDMSSFLFTVAPKSQIFMPTGFNCNLVYLNVIEHRHKPSCFAMGGSSSVYFNFSLSIDNDLSTGQSNEHIATFNNPILSGKQQFEIEKLEVWGFAGLEVKKHLEVECKDLPLLTDEDRITGKFLLKASGILKD